MIQYLRASNYRSIGKEQSINFLANSDKSHLEKVQDQNGTKILPVISIYGGNATGKTNFLKVLKTLKEIITGKLGIANAYDPCKFLKEDETSFEILFYKNDIKYYFCFKYNDKEILNEELYFYPNGKISKIFQRKKKNYTFGPTFEKKLKAFSESISTDVSFLRIINEFIKDDIKELYNVNSFFNDDLIFLGEELSNSEIEDVKEIFIEEENKKVKKFMDNFYRHLNIGAKGIVIRRSSPINKETFKKLSKKNLKELLNFLNDSSKKSIKMNTTNKEILEVLTQDNEVKVYLSYKINNNEIEIPIEEESKGIQNIFKFGKIISDALTDGKIIIFDELETGFHPILAKKLIELFFINKKSQLIFTTHNTNLLDLSIFRRDQIFFTKRTIDTEFTSELISLSDIKGIRKSTDIEKGYLHGKYCDSPTFKDIKLEV